jgi:hypothetical protein
MLDLVARQKALNYDPGEEFLYSNTNYFLLAEVVQRATKKPLSEFAAENIFQPLGMAHTWFYDDHTLVVPGRVPGYGPGKNGGFLVDWSTNFDKVGDGGLMSSVDDLFLWDRNFYKNRLGKGTLLKEMQTRGVLNSGKQISYALGLTLGEYGGLPIVEHGGALFGYRTEILRFPEQRLTVVCLCNLSSADPARLSRQVADVYLKKHLTPSTVFPHLPVAAPSGRIQALLSDAELAPYAGAYKSTELDATYKLSVDNGGLTLRTNWNPPKRLNPTVHDEFSAGGQMTLVFRRGAKDRISGFEVFAGRVRNVSFERAT